MGYAGVGSRTRLPWAEWSLRVALTAGGLAVLGWWVYAGSAQEARGLANALTSLARVAGLGAAYLCLVLVLLVARVPWFERAVGHDRLLTWHRALGTSTVVLMAAHIGLVVWGYSLADGRSKTDELWGMLTTYPAMLRAAVATALFLLVATTSGRLMRRHLSYELWWVVHLTTYAAILLAFGHQVRNGQDFLAHPGAQLVWLWLYLLVFGSVLWWRVLAPLITTATHAVRVDRVEVESPTVVSVWLRGDALRQLEVRAGQFVILRFLTRGLWTSGHPYSVSSAPGQDRLRITVRTAGDHSGRMRDLRAGTWAVVEGPYGGFTADGARGRAPALLLGAGVGIAPLLPLAHQLRERGHEVVVVARDSEEHTLRSDLAELTADGDVTLHSLIGRRTDLGHDPLSRLTDLVPDLSRRDVWVCGPPGFVHAAVELCLRAGVPAARINLEDFAW